LDSKDLAITQLKTDNASLQQECVAKSDRLLVIESKLEATLTEKEELENQLKTAHDYWKEAYENYAKQQAEKDSGGNSSKAIATTAQPETTGASLATTPLLTPPPVSSKRSAEDLKEKTKEKSTATTMTPNCKRSAEAIVSPSSKRPTLPLSEKSIILQIVRNVNVQGGKTILQLQDLTTKHVLLDKRVEDIVGDVEKLKEVSDKVFGVDGDPTLHPIFDKTDVLHKKLAEVTSFLGREDGPQDGKPSLTTLLGTFKEELVALTDNVALLANAKPAQSARRTSRSRAGRPRPSSSSSEDDISYLNFD
jgi:hypothetical protein